MSVGWILLGSAAVVVGTYLALTHQGPREFGWFAYTPLPGDVPTVEGIVLTTRLQIVGAAVCASGLIIVASSVSYHFGRRRRPDKS